MIIFFRGYMAVRGHLEICELLIKHDADINAKDEDRNTTLHEAVRGHLEICEHLFNEYQAEMDIDSLLRYRKCDDSQLKHCFRYFESKTDEELFDILTQKNATSALTQSSDGAV